MIGLLLPLSPVLYTYLSTKLFLCNAALAQNEYLDACVLRAALSWLRVTLRMHHRRFAPDDGQSMYKQSESGLAMPHTTAFMSDTVVLKAKAKRQ